ncbi:Transcription factor SOX-17 [Tritrichomonas musculus]|uniref:Transcription factor SOX-17 n=1 Tax=Tritrichomonas musculus TaxID=1915356 RepID=A0ABR2KKZ1_9EUKA
MNQPTSNFDMNYPAMGQTGAPAGWMPSQVPMQQTVQPDAQAAQMNVDEGEEGDNSRRPANAFILYSQTMRSVVRQDNPSLSNTEVSRLLGKMWKEVPNETKLQYKQRAAAAQEEFKRQHPDYTYRKARRKRALNELLTKSSQGFAGIPYTDPTQMQMFAANPAMPMYQMGMMQGVPTSVAPGMAGNVAPGMQPGMNGMQQMTGYPGMMDPSMQNQQGMPQQQPMYP